VVGSRKSGRLVLVVALALVLALTFGALLAVTVWADASSTERVKEVLQLLLTGEVVAFGVAVAWWLAVP
jgi:hypothetical protein